MLRKGNFLSKKISAATILYAPTYFLYTGHFFAHAQLLFYDNPFF